MMKHFLTTTFILVIFLAQAQKIPFQGKLTENDEPVTGSKTITFGFQSSTWSEVHESVSILDGFYSVVLGSITPIPDSLFSSSDEAQLTINVDGTQLSPITIYRPYQQTTFVDHYDGTNDRAALMVKRTGVAGSGFAAFESVAEMDDASYALYGQATGSGDNYGVYGFARGNGNVNLGMIGIARGAGDGTMSDFTGEVPVFGSYNTGLRGIGRDNVNGNTGVYGQATGNTGVDNIGVVGRSSVNDSSNTIRNVGTLGDAIGPGVNIGIHGQAFGGAENWAGWFDGDVNINGAIMVNGEPFSGGASSSLDSIESRDIKLINEAGKVRANLNIFNDAGSLVLNNANDSTKAILGSAYGGYGSGLYLYDSLRHHGARLMVTPDGVGNLFTHDVNHKVSGWFGNASGTGGFMQLAGYGQDGVFTGATLTGMASWNNGLPYFIMEGSSENPFTTLLEFGADSNGAGGEYGYFRLNSNQRVLDGLGAATVMEIDHNTHLPFFQLNGGNDHSWDARVRMSVDSVGNLGTAGRLSLIGPVANENGDPIALFEVNPVNDAGGADPNGASSEMFMWGDSSPNFQLGGKPWEENDFANFNMYGSHDDGGGWYQPNLSMSVYQASNYQSVDINLKNTQSGGVNIETVQLMSNMYENNGGGLVLRDSTGATTIDLIGQGGTINAVTVNQTSDRRLKENIQSQENSLEKIKSLRGVTFEWKSDDTNQQHIGFIAQEVEEIYPEMVTTKEDGYKSVNYAVLVSALVEAVKTLDSKVAELQTENNELKTELANSKADTSDLESLKAEIDSIKQILSLSVEDEQSATLGQNK